MVLVPALLLLAQAQEVGAADALRAARTMDLRVADPWLEPDPAAKLGPAAAPEAIRLLSRVRRAATFGALANALRRLGRRDAIPVLIENLDRLLDAPQNQAPYHALQAWGWEAIPALRRGLVSSRTRVRLDCARLLVEQCPQERVLKSPPLRPVMLALARDPDAAMRTVALQGLWRLAQHTHDWSMDAVHFVEGPYDPVAMSGVVDLAFDRDPWVRGLAVGRLAFLLGITRDEDHFDLFEGRNSKAVVEKVPGFLRSKDPIFRAAAVAVWRNHYGPQVEFSKPDPDALVRRATTDEPTQLGYVPVPDRWEDLKALPDLIRLADDPDPRVRVNAAERLRNVMDLIRPGPPTIRATLVRLSRDGEPSVRLASLGGLFRLAQLTHDRLMDAIHFSAGPYDPVALRSVLDLAYDFYPEVNRPARAHLAFLADLIRRETDPLPRPTDAKLAQAMGDREPAVRAAAVALAFGFGRPMLGRRGMGDDDPLVRYATRRGLRHSWPSPTGGEDDRKLADLVALLHDDRPGVRADAIDAIADAWRPSTIPTLMPRLRDPDPQVRAEAGHAIRALRGDYLLRPSE